MASLLSRKTSGDPSPYLVSRAELEMARWDFPGGLMVENPLAKQEMQISSLGKIPGEVNGNSLQYSCLGNPMDRGG